MQKSIFPSVFTIRVYKRSFTVFPMHFSGSVVYSSGGQLHDLETNLRFYFLSEIINRKLMAPRERVAFYTIPISLSQDSSVQDTPPEE